MKFLEIETKYRATDIKLPDFIEQCLKLSPKRRQDVGSFDHYYFKKGDDIIKRFRAGTRPELTVKRKTLDRNNFVRTEVNIPLDPAVTREEIHKSAICEGYEYDFTIFKTCVIFYWDLYNVVYYVVYDENLVERERFIEIEMSEAHSWASEEEAWNALVQVEKELAPLGITPVRRMRRSLQEIFTRAQS